MGMDGLKPRSSGRMGEAERFNFHQEHHQEDPAPVSSILELKCQALLSPPTSCVKRASSVSSVSES